MITYRPTDICRNCNSKNIVVSPNSYIASFFAKRVFCVESLPTNGEIISNFIEQINSKPTRNIFKFIYSNFSKNKKIHNYLHSRPSLKTEIIICNDCGFVGPRADISSEMLNSLYYDYRKDSYNFERCLHEPNYQSISSSVGTGQLEIQNRLQNVEQIISKYIDSTKILNVLDYGGGCGSFIPNSMKSKSVVILDVSDQPLVNSQWKRHSKLNTKMSFDYCQLCHVLEHIPHPYLLIHDISKYITPGGYIYIEVPQDRDENYMMNIYAQSSNFSHILHEHINLYSISSVAGLGKAAGLDQIFLEKRDIKIDWKTMPIISALFKKR